MKKAMSKKNRDGRVRFEGPQERYNGPVEPLHILGWAYPRCHDNRGMGYVLRVIGRVKQQQGR